MTEPRNIQVAFRLPSDLVSRIDEYSKEISEEFQIRINRTTAIERLLNVGLDYEMCRTEKKENYFFMRSQMKIFGFEDEDEFRMWDLSSKILLRARAIEENSQEWLLEREKMAIPGRREETIKTFYP